MLQEDISIIRELAKSVAEIAARPEQEASRVRWRRLNGLKPERPMVMIDQVCWHEMNVENELTLRCKDGLLREWEENLRNLLYQWKHFRVDMVVEDFIRVPKAISGTRFNIETQERLIASDAENGVSSHAYINQFETMDDLKKIKIPVIVQDESETRRREALAKECFDGLLTVRMEGIDPYLSVWDPIATWMGVEGALYALVDDPDRMIAMTQRIVSGFMSMLDQLEEQGLLCGPQSLVHCTGAWTDELPGQPYNPQKPTTRNVWMFGLAQMFSTVSPSMFEEYEIDACMPIFERFGLVYYGCCDPLDRKMKEVRRIPHLRKVSMSPWADKERGAAGIAGDFVYSCKPNPAFLATDSFDEDIVRRDLMETKRICEANGCPLEIILKDISTVRKQPDRLWRWAEIAMEVAHA